jgi:aminopeptidase-like protein
MNEGKKIFGLIRNLFPINRSLTGEGVRKTLKILKTVNSKLKVQQINSGTKVFDWIVPKEWSIKEAFIKDSKGNKICDFKKNNLHLLQYSYPLKKKVNLINLTKILYSLPNMPKAIPYVTSYYKKRSGFCISHREKKKLKKGRYSINIDTSFKNGVLNYGEIYIKGKSKKEIFISTNICHPSMANNELSGPALTIYLSNWISSIKNRQYSYRIVFVPETIGSLVYLKRNIKMMKKNIVAGFNIVCVGDDKIYSYIPSRLGNTISDKISLKILKRKKLKFKKYTWLDRGSDERQYCSPGVDLPVCSITRSKYFAYKEYHTSLDDLNFISIKGLQQSFNLYKDILSEIEKNQYPKTRTIGEAFLSKRNLFPNIGGSNKCNNLYQNITSYADGKNSVTEIAHLCKQSIKTTKKTIKVLVQHGLLKL